MSFLSDGVCKPFSVRPAAEIDLMCRTPEIGVSILSNGVGKSFSVRAAADETYLFIVILELEIFSQYSNQIFKIFKSN